MEVKDIVLNWINNKPDFSKITKACGVVVGVQNNNLVHEDCDEDCDEEDSSPSLEWIFEHGNEIVSGNACSWEVPEVLFHCLYPDKSLWGIGGEFYAAACNTQWVVSQAAQFLKHNDLDGWLKFAEEFRNSKK